MTAVARAAPQRYSVEVSARRPSLPMPWRPILLYAVLLAAGIGLLQWLDYQRLVRSAPGEVYIALVAVAFLALGITLGWRLTRPVATAAGDPAVRTALGISPREFEVLEAVAQGLTTKQIARALGCSPNTVKTHLSRLFEKLPAANRTEATARARALGLLH